MGFSFVGSLLARNAPYASKIDNFIEYKDIDNFCFSSLEDEVFHGYPQSVGVIQLYDRKDKNVDREDYTRVFYLKKLLGSMIVRAEASCTAFQVLLGCLTNPQIEENLKKGAATLTSDFSITDNCSAVSIGMNLSYIKRSFNN